MGTNVAAQPTVVAPEGISIGSVTAPDGTTLGYRRLGQGPGVVVVHGSASSGYNHRQLAEALADAFTVYLPDRRGRGLSGPFGQAYSIRDEVADLRALLAATGAELVFGVSSGAIVCLQAALELPAIRKVAIFEPPLFLGDTATPTAVLRRFDRELAAGKLAAAMITGMKGAQMGPPLFNFLPNWLLERLVGMALRGEERKGAGEYVPMRAIAPTLHHDFQLVVEMSGTVEPWRAIQAEVLLLGGSKSPAYLKAALDGLARVLAGAERIELAAADHAASWNSDRGGKPEPVARELRRFFA